jgi:hypothetical protein
MPDPISDCLKCCYRKEKEAALQPAVGKLKRMVAIQVMDQVQAKLQSSNRSKQVSSLICRVSEC